MDTYNRLEVVKGLVLMPCCLSGYNDRRAAKRGARAAKVRGGEGHGVERTWQQAAQEKEQLKKKAARLHMDTFRYWIVHVHSKIDASYTKPAVGGVVEGENSKLGQGRKGLQWDPNIMSAKNCVITAMCPSPE